MHSDATNDAAPAGHSSTAYPLLCCDTRICVSLKAGISAQHRLGSIKVYSLGAVCRLPAPSPHAALLPSPSDPSCPLVEPWHPSHSSGSSVPTSQACLAHAFPAQACSLRNGSNIVAKRHCIRVSFGGLSFVLVSQAPAGVRPLLIWGSSQDE